MLYTENLGERIFRGHEEHESDELTILSGYLGPQPVEKLLELPIRSSVIYGMYGSEGITQSLHQSLVNTCRAADNVQIFYSKKEVHSKCYVWKRRGTVTKAFIGSANFSRKGLNTPQREILMDCAEHTMLPLSNYVDSLRRHQISCLDDGVRIVVPSPYFSYTEETPINHTNSTLLPLLDHRGILHGRSGLNWGFSQGNVTPDDAYLPLRNGFVQSNLFIIPPKVSVQPVELLWDDGVVMEGSFEGNGIVTNGLRYPKQLSTRRKSELGRYIRRRLSLPSGALITREHLLAYGRSHIGIRLVGDGIYEMDFSV